MAKQRHKYGVAPVEDRTFAGIVFHSKKECLRYQVLCDQAVAGEIFELELQPKFSWRTTHEAEGRAKCHVYSYKADFRYIDSEGEEVIEDVKGFRTSEYRRKKRIVEYLFKIKIKEI